MENIQLADQLARRGKGHQRGVIRHDRQKEQNQARLLEMLQTRTYKTSPYGYLKLYDPKERDIAILPYWPDRICHHALMIHLKEILVDSFISQTYNCIQGRGIEGAFNTLRDYLGDTEMKYCLKMDIRKFYQSVNNEILKKLLRRKFKDPDLLWLLDEIIDSHRGLPLGNYTSQYLANFYLSRFDHWIKEELKVRYYLRYADDIVILGGGKQELHALRARIANYLFYELDLEVKSNYQVFPIQDRGIDYLGYVFRSKYYILLRKRIKLKYQNMMKYHRNSQSIASYRGWLLRANTKNLRNGK